MDVRCPVDSVAKVQNRKTLKISLINLMNHELAADGLFRESCQDLASVPLLTDDSQIGANLRVCADGEDRADIDQRG